MLETIKNTLTNEKQIEEKIDNFLIKNNGTGYILFFEYKNLKAFINNNQLEKVIKNTIEILSINSENKQIEYNKDNTMLLDINKYEGSKEYLKKELNITKYPILLKLYNYTIIDYMDILVNYK